MGERDVEDELLLLVIQPGCYLGRSAAGVGAEGDGREAGRGAGGGWALLTADARVNFLVVRVESHSIPGFLLASTHNETSHEPV